MMVALLDSQTAQERAHWEAVSARRSTLCLCNSDDGLSRSRSGYNTLRPLFWYRRFGHVVWVHRVVVGTDVYGCGLPLGCQYTPPPVTIIWAIYGWRGLLWRVRDGLAWISSRCVRNVDAHLWA